MTYWTIVHKDNKSPVIPFDCNPTSKDEGMLVYYSYQAARASSCHQNSQYELDCEPCKLGDESRSHLRLAKGKQEVTP